MKPPRSSVFCLIKFNGFVNLKPPDPNESSKFKSSFKDEQIIYAQLKFLPKQPNDELNIPQKKKRINCSDKKKKKITPKNNKFASNLNFFCCCLARTNCYRFTFLFSFFLLRFFLVLFGIWILQTKISISKSSLHSVTFFSEFLFKPIVLINVCELFRLETKKHNPPNFTHRNLH